jgi:hypothetical protein
MIRFALIDAKVYRQVVGSTAVGGTLCNTVKDVSLKVSRDEAKLNSRLTDWELVAALMKKAEFEVEFNDNDADTHLTAFKAAGVNSWPNNCISLYVTDGINGLDADFTVVNMERSEKLEGEPILYKFTCKPTLYTLTRTPQWV